MIEYIGALLIGFQLVLSAATKAVTRYQVQKADRPPIGRLAQPVTVSQEEIMLP